MLVFAVSTQGQLRSINWVTSYEILHSKTGSQFQKIMEGSSDKAEVRFMTIPFIVNEVHDKFAVSIVMLYQPALFINSCRCSMRYGPLCESVLHETLCASESPMRFKGR